MMTGSGVTTANRPPRGSEKPLVAVPAPPGGAGRPEVLEAAVTNPSGARPEPYRGRRHARI